LGEHDSQWTLLQCEADQDSLYDLRNLSLPKEADTGHVIDVKLIPVGTWQHPKHGRFTIDASVVSDMVTNFNSGVVGREIAFEAPGHANDGTGAYGWIMELESRLDGLWGKMRLTDLGLFMVRNERYRYLSPEMIVGSLAYTDPNGKKHKNVLYGVSPTNHPFFTVLTETPLAAEADVEPDDAQEGVEPTMSTGTQDNTPLAPVVSAEDFQKVLASLDATNASLAKLSAENTCLTAEVTRLHSETATIRAEQKVAGWQFSHPLVIDDQLVQGKSTLAPAHRALVLKMLGELKTDTGAEFIACMDNGGFEFVPLGEAAVLHAAAKPSDDEAIFANHPPELVAYAKQTLAANPGMAPEEAILCAQYTPETLDEARALVASKKAETLEAALESIVDARIIKH